MVNYKKMYVSNINSEIIEETYRSLLENKWHFVILDVNGVLNVLTKEKSIFEINNEQQFINEFEQDIYYKTIISNQKMIINENDLKIYKEYIQKYPFFPSCILTGTIIRRAKILQMVYCQRGDNLSSNSRFNTKRNKATKETEIVCKRKPQIVVIKYQTSISSRIVFK